MPKGGARNRSGPPPDPNSARSEARGYKLAALPPEGYRGPIPDFPLVNPTTREYEWWAWAWRTPQACAWSRPSQSWRIPIVGQWVRVFTRCEDHGAPASLFGQLHRLGDQVGLTTAGMHELGWTVAVDELAERRKPPAPAGPVYNPRQEYRYESDD